MIILRFLTVIFFLLLAACGGGGGSSSPDDDQDSDKDPAISFNQAKGFDGPVNVILPLNDGSGVSYFAGDFTAYNDTAANRIIRVNQDGSVDTRFNIGSGFNARVTALIHTNDGSGDIVVGGQFSTYQGEIANYIVRLNDDGSIDDLFSAGDGFSVGSSLITTIRSFAIADDGTGDLYVGGWFFEYNGTRAKGIVRLDRDGSLDETFVSGEGLGVFGDPNIDLYGADVIATVGDGSGDVYVTGTFTSYDTNATGNLLRLNSDGSVDTSFNSGSAFDSTIEIVKSMQVANDGSGDLYVGGSFGSYNGTSTTTIVRINNDGSIDTAFGTGSGFNGEVRSIALSNDGSGDVYAAGSFSSYRANMVSNIVRINSDGSYDGNFSTAAGFDSDIDTIALSTEGSIQLYIAGAELAQYADHGFNYVARLDSAAAIDTTFNVGAGFNDRVVDASPSRDGSGDIYACGPFTRYNGQSVNGLVRLNGNGTLDTDFQPAAVVNNNSILCEASKDGTAKVYVYTRSEGLRRLEADGSLDTSFAIHDTDKQIAAIYLPDDSSGDIYIGGLLSPNLLLQRLKADGSIDNTFEQRDGNGDPLLGFTQISSIIPALDGTNDIYVAHQLKTTVFGDLMRFDDAGILQTGFDVGSGFDSLPQDIAPARDGSGDLYAAGGGDFRVEETSDKIRIRFNGLRDTVFNASSFNLAQQLITLDNSSEDIVVFGSSAVQRLNRQGLITDGFEYPLKRPTFAAPGFSSPSTFIGEAFLAEDGSGDMFAVGHFIGYDNNVVNNIIRISPSGELR